MNELKELLIDEVSLVNAGANPEANIVFFKRKEPIEMADKKEVQKDLANENLVTKLQKDLEAAVGEIIDKKETPAPVVNVETPAPVVNVEVKSVEKVDLSALNNDLEALKSRLSSHIEKVEHAEFVKIASKYELIGENAETLAKTLKDAKAVSEETYNSLIKILDKAYDATEKAGTFKEIGRSGSGQADSPQQQIEKIAADLRSKDSTLGYRESIDKAFVANPHLQY